jgi:hypothetical protein
MGDRAARNDTKWTRMTWFNSPTFRFSRRFQSRKGLFIKFEMAAEIRITKWIMAARLASYIALTHAISNERR